MLKNLFGGVPVGTFGKIVKENPGGNSERTLGVRLQKNSRLDFVEE